MRSDRADELGARLRRDAARLAARYPAPMPRPLAGPLVRSRRLNSVVPILLASVVVLILIAVGWQPGSNESDVPRPRGLADASDQTIAESPNDLTAAAASSAADDHGSSPIAFEPPGVSQWESPVFLLEVSDPELEGLLDLWETDRTEPTRLSI